MSTVNPGNPMRITDRLNRWLETLKNAVIAVVSVLGLGITSVGILNGVLSDEVSLEEIKVPAIFEEQGYRADITTVRILDDIKRYQNSNSSAKERVSFFGSHPRDQHTNLQLAGTGVDVKALQSFVRDSLGIVSARISGEITAKKTDSNVEYHIKIRQTPENLTLVDFKTYGAIEEVISQTALRILEATDPHIAAAAYWSMGNEPDALRMIDTVLGNTISSDDKYSLNLRAYINLTHKRYELAQRDIDEITRIAPDFVPLLSSKSWLARERGDFSEGLKLAEEQIRRAPEKWWGYQAKALSLQGLKQDERATAAHMKLISMRPEVPGPYLSSGRYFLSKQDYDRAAEAFRVGLSKHKDHPILNLLYADVLQKQQMYVQAQSIYRRFQDNPKFRIHALVGISEVLKAQNRTGDFNQQRLILKKYLKEHPMNEGDAKMFSKRIAELTN